MRDIPLEYRKLPDPLDPAIVPSSAELRAMGPNWAVPAAKMVNKAAHAVDACRMQYGKLLEWYDNSQRIIANRPPTSPVK